MNLNCYETVDAALAEKITAQEKEIELLKWELKKCKQENAAKRMNEKDD